MTQIPANKSIQFRFTRIGALIILLWGAAFGVLILNSFNILPRDSLIVGRWIYTLDLAAVAATFVHSLYRHAKRMAAIQGNQVAGDAAPRRFSEPRYKRG